MRKREIEWKEFDEIVRGTLTQKVKPEQALKYEVLRKMNRIHDENYGAGQEGGFRLKDLLGKKIWLKPVAALLGLALFVGIAGTAVGGITKEGYLKHIFGSGGEQYIYSDDVSDYTCDILSYEVDPLMYEGWKNREEDKIKNDLDITPVLFCTDGFYSYVIVKVTGKHGIQLTEKMHFDDASMSVMEQYNEDGSSTRYGEGGNSAETWLKYDEEEHAVYYILNQTGVDLKMGEKYTIGIGTGGWWDMNEKGSREVLHDGWYRADMVVQTKKASSAVMLYDKGLGPKGSVRLSPMGFCITLDLGTAGISFYEGLLGKIDPEWSHKEDGMKVKAELKDGSNVKGIIQGESLATREGDRRSRIYVTFESIVSIKKIKYIWLDDLKLEVNV